MNKYLSIITNFGCHYSCPYCIVKENNLHIPKTTIKGLDNIQKYANENQCNWISISGGGDPLFPSEISNAWYNKLFNLTTDYNLELHTSYFDLAAFNYDEFDRVVYHLRNLNDIKKIVKYKSQTVRVVFVVTENFTQEYIDKIVKEVKLNPYIDELSFRQMVDSNYNTTHYCEDYLRNGHKKDWWYITQGDYNLYYCENKISTKYENFKSI